MRLSGATSLRAFKKGIEGIEKVYCSRSAAEHPDYWISETVLLLRQQAFGLLSFLDQLLDPLAALVADLLIDARPSVSAVFWPPLLPASCTVIVPFDSCLDFLLSSAIASQLQILFMNDMDTIRLFALLLDPWPAAVTEDLQAAPKRS